jgi:hypothetical protein
MMKMQGLSAATIFLALFATGTLFAQVAPQARHLWAADQLTATVLHTVDDYSLETAPFALQRVRLDGIGVELASRRLYPLEIVGVAQYSEGELLGQKLLSMEGGVGYCRKFNDWTPFARVTGGVARTSSDDLMYLKRTPQPGFTSTVSAGLDFQLIRRWGVRGIQVQNQYLPFGSRGSVYWSIGTGIVYRFHR